jgi:hypothetical protein
MSAPWLDANPDVQKLDLTALRDDVVEISLLLPGWQFAALQKVARRNDQTTGETVRRLVRDFLMQDA